MISPMTAPGTRVVCIHAGATLIEGAVYTVQAITRHGISSRGYQPFGVLLWEEKPVLGCDAFCPTRFRLADLPRCLTELLEPVNLPREALV